MNEKAQLHVRIPKDVYKKLKVKCVYNDSSLQEYLANLITESVGESSAKEKSVLIVDGEPIVRKSLKDWLKDNYKVATAETGEEAVRLMKRQDFDILIVDCETTWENCIVVLREAKAIKPHIRSIVITASYASVELAVEAMKLGAVDFLIKPITPKTLEKLI